MSVSVSNRTPGEFTIHAPQKFIDGLVQNCECEGIKVVGNANVPTPVPDHQWDFSAPSPAAAQAAKVQQAATETPVLILNTSTEDCLGVPEWYFGDEAVAAQGGQVANKAGASQPMPDFEWSF